ncbi:MAG: hypothetical protein FWD36_09405 [Treponema sp.]|nr:hypothetical protein [Treponema sp.]
MVFEQCRDVLLQESELVQRIGALQNLIREAVVSRDWTDFEGHFNALGGLGEEFTALENERKRLFAGIQTETGDSARFYAFVAQFPRDQRAELSAIYRSLKLESLRVRMAGQTLMGYIVEARTTIAGFFEIAFPDRGGKIYTPHGVPVSHDMRSMVLNRAF